MKSSEVNSTGSGSVAKNPLSRTGSARAFNAMMRGGVGFGIVALAAFSVWAASGKWFYALFGEAGLYAACAIVFIIGSGLFLHGLIPGPRSVRQFYGVFVPAFIAYAIVWCGAWFLLHFGLGEWLGSFFGSLAFAAVAAWRFKTFQGFVKASLVLFGCHSVGYFLGGLAMGWVTAHRTSLFGGLPRDAVSIIAKLSWGLLYGLGFGAGIGFTFHVFQSRNYGNVNADSART